MAQDLESFETQCNGNIRVRFDFWRVVLLLQLKPHILPVYLLLHLKILILASYSHACFSRLVEWFWLRSFSLKRILAFSYRTDRIHATFLKIVLISEQRRETRGFKLFFIVLQVFNGWISYVSFYDIPKALKECLEKNVHDCDVLKPPMDSVRPSSINFWILLFTWLSAC